MFTVIFFIILLIAICIIVPFPYSALVLLAFLIGYKLCANIYYNRVVKMAVVLKKQYGDNAVDIVNKELYDVK